MSSDRRKAFSSHSSSILKLKKVSTTTTETYYISFGLMRNSLIKLQSTSLQRLSSLFFSTLEGAHLLRYSLHPFKAREDEVTLGNYDHLYILPLVLLLLFLLVQYHFYPLTQALYYYFLLFSVLQSYFLFLSYSNT